MSESGQSLMHVLEEVRMRGSRAHVKRLKFNGRPKRRKNIQTQAQMDLYTWQKSR